MSAKIPTPTPTITLVLGASRGLGLALTQNLSQDSSRTVFGTVRSTPEPGTFPPNVRLVSDIDVSQEGVGEKLVQGIRKQAQLLDSYLNHFRIDQLYVVAGVLKPEEPLKPSWDDEINMYKTCTLGPLFAIISLVNSGLLAHDSKIIFVTSEAGSLTLRTAKEGGGMYGHHGSKAAANMMGRLLGFDLKSKGITVAIIHPGFLKTEMTKGAGFEDAYESGGGGFRIFLIFLGTQNAETKKTWLYFQAIVIGSCA